MRYLRHIGGKSANLRLRVDGLRVLYKLTNDNRGLVDVTGPAEPSCVSAVEVESDIWQLERSDRVRKRSQLCVLCTSTLCNGLVADDVASCVRLKTYRNPNIGILAQNLDDWVDELRLVLGLASNNMSADEWSGVRKRTNLRWQRRARQS